MTTFPKSRLSLFFFLTNIFLTAKRFIEEGNSLDLLDLIIFIDIMVYQPINAVSIFMSLFIPVTRRVKDSLKSM